MSDRKKIILWRTLTCLFIGSLIGLSVRTIEIWEEYKTAQVNYQIMRENYIDVKLENDNISQMYEEWKDKE